MRVLGRGECINSCCSVEETTHRNPTETGDGEVAGLKKETHRGAGLVDYKGDARDSKVTHTGGT